MASVSDDLFVRLINHRISNEKARWEDYLTECFAWLLRHDPDLQARLLCGDGCVFFTDAHSARALTEEDVVEVETQVDQGRAGRPDMQITSQAGFRLLVECKAGEPFDRQQVERYLGTVEGYERGSVVAIVPRRTRQSVASVPDHPRFLGIVDWEAIGAEVDQLPQTGEPIATFRTSFLRLLSEYHLVPIEDVFPLPWDLDAETQDVDRVKTICRVLDRVVYEVADDRLLMSRAPALYRPGDGGTWNLQPFAHSPLISGKGPSPRPILTHRAELPSMVHEFSSLLFHVHFLRKQAAGVPVEPSVAPDFRIGMHFAKWYGNNAPEFLRRFLAAGGVIDGNQLHDVEERAPVLMQAFRERSEALMDRVAAALGEARVVTEGWPRRDRYHDSQLSLSLMTTTDLVCDPVDTRKLAERYRRLLVGTLESFFSSEPTQPLAMLVAEACMPRMGRL